MRPILWHVAGGDTPPWFAILFPTIGDQHTVAILNFRRPCGETEDATRCAISEMDALTDEQLALVRETAKPVLL
jgi:hypothetical protein